MNIIRSVTVESDLIEEETSIPSHSSLDDRVVVPRLLNADEIIQRSYERTFGALSTEISCNTTISGRTCIESLLSEAMQISSRPNSTHNFPWWFITMLRDIPIQYALGPWHNLTIMDPPMDFCTIEKIATTQWRNVQCALNENKDISRAPRPCNLKERKLAVRQKSSNVSKVVILRDPLERLLSGYINKCVSVKRRRLEGHCEPNAVFNESGLTQQIELDPKQLFAAYVDGFPLKWNMHFFPQSIYCDGLFRHINQYDFVGYMGHQFYEDLTTLAARFGNDNKLPEALEKVFHYSEQSKNDNVGKETQAPAHVKEYYTAASVRRALEYFAVDYMALGLEVPSWAKAILAEESDTFPINDA